MYKNKSKVRKYPFSHKSRSSRASVLVYSRTSIARTPMARLPWPIRTHFLSPYEILPLAQENKYLGKFSYFIMKLYSLESPHRGDSNEYTQHTIIVKEIKKSLNYCYLLPDLALYLTLSGSNYPRLEQFSMVPTMFEPLKFDCIV